MDDSLLPTPSQGPQDESDVEEDVPDWTALAKLTAKHGDNNNNNNNTAVPFIPKRGEKDFAPVASAASQQAQALAASRRAMFAALQAGEARQHSSRSYNRATWHPELQLASMEVHGAHGVAFQTLGRYSSERQRIELWPEETLYLVERGGLECWTEEGVAMSTQHVWAVAFSGGSLTLEQYQIYAYLRRLGYSVHRASAGRPQASSAADMVGHPSSTTWSALWSKLSRQLWSALTWPYRRCWARLPYATTTTLARGGGGGLVRRLLPLEPVHRSLLSGLSWWNYAQAFQALRIIPSSREPIPQERKDRVPSEYKVFWHVYKPNRKYKKTDLPPPDFNVVVIDGSTTRLPTLDQIEVMGDSKVPTSSSSSSGARPAPSSPSSFVERIKRMFSSSSNKPAARRKKNLYPILKTPQDQVMLAVVDQGTSYFLRLTKPHFAAHPWV